MTSSSELQREIDRWKDKYFDQGESFEQEKAVAEEYAGLLKRLLVRVSLAAENVSEELDHELDGLRSAIREATPEKNDLTKRLKRIDDFILSADEGKQKNAELVIQAMADLIQQLLSLKVPRKQKRQLKKLEKSLESRALHFREFPGILSEYAILQAESLKEIVGDQPADSGGFFSRFLGGSKSESLRVESDQNDAQDTEADIEVVTVEEAELAVELDGHTEKDGLVGQEFIPGFATISGHICSTLNGLLDQLSFPDSARRDVENLRLKVGGKLNWYELGPTLDDLSSLVLSVVGRGQRDFERFLLVLDERLSKVQGFLEHTRLADEQWLETNSKFDNEMRAKVDAMGHEVEVANELDELKRSITAHIDMIASMMDAFRDDSKAFRNDKDEELEQLKARMEEMEKESVAIRQRLKEERSKALTDKLTGLASREAYDERVELELERWKRYKNPVVLVVADIDHFKSINDTYGHMSGDKVLQIIAKELKNRTRKTDFVARYGGEEFVILLPETQLEQAQEVIEKTREMISLLPFHFKEKSVRITMSFGLVAFAEGRSISDLFELGDKALYQAKENGRNCIFVSD